MTVAGRLGPALTFLLPGSLERCWPNAATIEAYEFTRLVEAGDEVLVTYEARKTDGRRFRNTEVLTFDGDR